MRALLAILFLLLFGASPAFAATEWKLLKHEGRDYVTLENVAEFYQLGGVRRTSNSFTMRNEMRSLRGENGSAEFFINNLKFILSYPVTELNGKLAVSRMDLTKLIEPVMRPNRIKSAGLVDTVILDAGHGGSDNGATSPYGNEKTYALDVALRARAQLKAAGFTVHLSRMGDELVPLEDRARFASRFPNALFIAIHFNSGGSAASGVETYTLAPRGVPSMAADGPAPSDLIPFPGNSRDAENIALACATHAALVNYSGLYDRGIKRARFVVLREATTPGVLLECGFLSNPNDARRIATAAYREQIATAIMQAVKNYRNAVGHSMPMASRPEGSGPVVMTPGGSDRVNGVERGTAGGAATMNN